MAATRWSTQTRCKHSGSHVSKSKAADSYTTYMAKDDLDKLLLEATSNENWNISNTKLLQIADATYEM